MSTNVPLRDIYQEFFVLSRIESKLLDTIVKEESGNAYSLWKASDLKHYPTVLRTLKKFRKKGLVQVLSEKGLRGETTYIPTFLGILAIYKINGEKKKIIELIEKNSDLFKELISIDKKVNWVVVVVREMILDSFRPEKPRSIDEIVRAQVEVWLDDYVLNIRDETPEWIIKLSKLKWVKPIALKVIQNQLDWLETNTKELTDLKKTLTK